MTTDVTITGDGLSALQAIADNGAPLGPGGGVAMEGTSAAGTTDDGSDPVKVGGVYTATPPTLTDGQRGNLSFDVRNNVRVILASPAGPSATLQAPSADGNGIAATGLGVGPSLYNGSSWDRWRNNRESTALSSSARTATTNSGDLTNYNSRFLHVIIDVTAATGSPSVVFTVQGKDAASSVYYTLLASAAITGIGTTVLRIGPGLTTASNLVANDIVPRTWRVLATHGNTDSITYSVGYALVV